MARREYTSCLLTFFSSVLMIALIMDRALGHSGRAEIGSSSFSSARNLSEFDDTLDDRNPYVLIGMAPTLSPGEDVFSKGSSQGSKFDFQQAASAPSPWTPGQVSPEPSQPAIRASTSSSGIITDFHIRPMEQRPTGGSALESGSFSSVLQSQATQVAMSAITELQSLTRRALPPAARPAGTGDSTPGETAGSGSSTNSSPTVGDSQSWGMDPNAVRDFMRQQAATQNSTSEISHYSEQRGADGTTMGTGYLSVRGADGTLLRQRSFSAPLVPQPELERLLAYQKLHAAATAFSVHTLTLPGAQT
jgi:hypothetical protein